MAVSHHGHSFRDIHPNQTRKNITDMLARKGRRRLHTYCNFDKPLVSLLKPNINNRGLNMISTLRLHMNPQQGVLLSIN